MSNQIQPIERLRHLEKELGVLLKVNRKSWVKVGKLLLTIEQEQLYLLKYPSFTQYVQHLANFNRINVSTFWRAKSAVRTFMKLANVRQPEQLILQNIKTTPEQLELYNRIKTVVPEKILEQVRQKMVRGEGVRNELYDLWKVYKPLKKGKTERGRKSFNTFTPTQAHTFSESVKTQEPTLEMDDFSKMEKFDISFNEMQKANIVNSLRASSWIRYTTDAEILQSQFFSRIPCIAYDVVTLLLAKSSSETQRPELVTFGARIICDLYELRHSFQWIESSCNYNYLVIPLAFHHDPSWVSKLPENVGIIATDSYSEQGKIEAKFIRKASFVTTSFLVEKQFYQMVTMHLLHWNA